MYRTPSLIALDSASDFSEATSHTLHRLGQDWFYFRASVEQSREHRPLAWLTEQDCLSDADRPAATDPQSLKVRVTCKRISPFRVMRSMDVEHFNLVDPSERLCLLARFAAEQLKRDNGIEQSPFGTGISLCISLIQQAFDLHLTVENMSRRIGIDATTLRRWFSRESTGTIENQLIFGRVRALQQEVQSSGDSVSECARRLQFANVQSAGRMLRAYCRGR